MNFAELKEFIDRGMRMSHIYQPVMLLGLLGHGGKMKDVEIAKALLAHDQSQIEYYTKITNSMVGKVLRDRGAVSRSTSTNEYSLIGFDSLTSDQIADLEERCKHRLLAYLDSRGDRLFQHRRKSEGYISGTIRYEVLKRSKFHCELCGISAETKALEVDHIIPRNKGGSDELSNLQGLCYSCNAMKRDRDDTDFRLVREAYNHRVENCLFCIPPEGAIIETNELAYVIPDGFAVTPGHALIIPKRHISTYFELGQAEINACSALLKNHQGRVRTADPSVTGFNIGVNVGETAGQTIMHCHIHLIPRRRGDVSDPIGGIRNVIPCRGNYMQLSEQKSQDS